MDCEATFMIYLPTIVICDDCRARVELPGRLGGADLESALQQRRWAVVDGFLVTRHRCPACVERMADDPVIAELLAKVGKE